MLGQLNVSNIILQVYLFKYYVQTNSIFIPRLSLHLHLYTFRAVTACFFIQQSGQDDNEVT
jgi:hypothetical protein